MKKIILAASFSVLIAAPAFAQAPYGYYRPYGYEPYAYQPYAYGPYAYGGFGYEGSDVVVADGRVIGQDPDPNVRLEIRRDSQLSDIYQY